MARLNEPAAAPQPSAETVDVVRRRYLRQNRELAKTNSQQSIRIRALENDTARLLSENLSLREQVLQLQNALEAQSNRPSFENIDSVKDQLEAKMQEFGALVAELGQLKKKDDGLPRCKSQTAATRRSPDERQWRSGLGLQEVENAMLPTIAEGKSYPRRTMNADELRETLDNPDSQSPDIGPPPVSRFENETPIAFVPSPSPEAHLFEEPVEDMEPVLPMNLETRRKRRESGPKANIRRVSLFESPPEETEEARKKSTRVGAKRKFSVQEDEDKVKPPGDMFRFSRRTTQIEDATSSEQPKSQPSERPVLSSKPINTDPVLSPKKQRSSTSDKPDKPEKKTLPKTGRGRLTITRNVQPDMPPLEMADPIPTAEIMLDSLPPKTPAADDVFSPPSTEPSTQRPESKDTPPPGDLNSDTQSGLVVRPSRRVRAQVSYKEPSLNSKMRRPGKELMDAVMTSDHGCRMSLDSEVPPSTCGKVMVKQEPDDSTWKPLGAVASTRATEDGEMGSPLRQKLDRREGTHDAKPDLPTLNSSAAASAISALIGETRRKSGCFTAASSTRAVVEPCDSSPQPKPSLSKSSTVDREQDADLAIFDFNESSPPTDSSAVSRPRIELAKTVRSARRHSALPASVAATPFVEDRKAESNLKLDGALPAVHRRMGSGTIRHSSTTTLARSTSAARAPAKDKERKTSALPPSASSINLATKVEGEGAGNLREGRAERAATRRKSMMT